MLLAVLRARPGGGDLASRMQDPALALYPVNALRNLVVDQARTNWVLPLDADFVPSAGLCGTPRRRATAPLPSTE